MPSFLVITSNDRNTAGQSLHRTQSCVIAHRMGRKRPHITQRHRPEALTHLSANGADRTVHIDEYSFVLNPAAKLDGNTVLVLLIAMANAFEANIVCLCRCNNLK